MSTEISGRTLLLLHDGELADVRALGESAGARVVECRPAEVPALWDVLVATGRHAHGEHLRGGAPEAVRIAVLDRNTRSLRQLVRRSGFDLVVRRPVHPTVLRLLLLHALYRGPERRSRRVAIGVPVRFRAGLLRREGVLADLSLRGCQVLSKHTPRVGHGVVVWIPEASGAAKPFAVRGSVVRAITGGRGERGFGVDFGRVSKDDAAHLRAAMQHYLEGPATTSQAPALDPGATHPVMAATASPDPAADEPAPQLVADSSDRRLAERHHYGGRRVVALGEEAARVLIGRDLSRGGMRVDRVEGLVVGQRFRVALHVAPGQTPLVVQAELLRDDGERGFAIRFTDVDEAASRYLTKMVDSLPVVGASGGGVVVSEIVGELLAPRSE